MTDHAPRADGGAGSMISCEDAMRRVYEYLDGELDTGWAEQVREHIEVCVKCYPYFNFERIFLDHVRSQTIAPERSERLERRILEALTDIDESGSGTD